MDKYSFTRGMTAGSGDEVLEVGNFIHLMGQKKEL